MRCVAAFNTSGLGFFNGRENAEMVHLTPTVHDLRLPPLAAT